MIGAVVAAPELIRLVGGEQFANSYRPFQLVVIFYVYIMLADNIFSGIHFPLNREGAYVRSYLVYFCVSVVFSYFFIVWLMTPESGMYGLCLGGVVHFCIALFQTRAYVVLFPLLTQTALRVFAVLLLVVACLRGGAGYERFAIGAVALFLIVADAMRNDPEMVRKVVRRIP
jgi:hypothetical protein